MGFLSAEELQQLLPAETFAYPSPIPTQSVSSDEFMPAPQTKKQREFEARSKNSAASWRANKVCPAALFSRPPPAWQRPLSP
jgi:hypothetical protein